MLNPNRLRATDYKFNRTVSLPKPQQADIELKHEIRKSESIKAFEKIVSKPTGTKNTKRIKTPLACQSNLTPDELKGLKSLQNRVARGELVICESDKSSKLCVLSRDQYIASGNKHLC